MAVTVVHVNSDLPPLFQSVDDYVVVSQAEVQMEDRERPKSDELYEVQVEALETLGLDFLKHDEKRLRVRSVEPGGVIDTWNTSHAAKVSPGHVLCSLNGHSGNSDELTFHLAFHNYFVLTFMIP